MNKIYSIIKAVLPLISDTNSQGKRKISIGRAPLFMVLATMCWKYASTGAGPDSGILAFIGMAMAYNGFSKTKLTQGDGGNNDTVSEPGSEG
jgi:hypothetical protein